MGKLKTLIMELGLDFEDDDFDEAEKPQTKQPTVYNAKICEPLWFYHADTSDLDTAANIFKFRGDNCYYHGKYQEAAKHYQEAIDHLPTQSRSLRHDFEESLARCFLYMDKFTEALDIANKLICVATNIDQQMQGLLLQSQIQSKMANIKEEEKSVQKLICLHPFNVNFWFRLKNIYRKQKNLQGCVYKSEEESVKYDAMEYVKILTCLIRARLLLKCTRKAVGSFVKSKYENLQKQVEEEIADLNPSDDWINKATAFLGEDIFKLDQIKENENESANDVTATLLDFDDHWFSWAEDLPAR